MKRIVILLLTILLMTTTCFSQNTSIETNQDWTVSSEQIKYANLIFVEHEKLLIENNLLNSEINSLQDKIKLCEQTDSIRLKQVDYLNKTYTKQIKDLNKKKNKTILGLGIGFTTVSIGLIIMSFVR